MLPWAHDYTFIARMSWWLHRVSLVFSIDFLRRICSSLNVQDVKHIPKPMHSLAKVRTPNPLDPDFSICYTIHRLQLVPGKTLNQKDKHVLKCWYILFCPLPQYSIKTVTLGWIPDSVFCSLLAINYSCSSELTDWFLFYYCVDAFRNSCVKVIVSFIVLPLW